MQKIENEINNYLKKIDGKIIGIGLSEKNIKEIEKNNKIVFCDLLDTNNSNTGKEKGNIKKLYCKDVRKKYKKKNINYIIGDISKINKYKNNFIKDSIYINKNKIIYYTDDIDTLNLYIKRYKRYNVIINVIDCKDGKILDIDTSHAKNKYLMDKIYYVLDRLYDLVDIIGEIFVS